MKMGWWRTSTFLLAFAALGAMAAAPAEAAQQADRDCRCVDLDGNDLDDCTCFRLPRPEAFAAPFGWASVNARPRLGISVNTSQGSDLDAAGAEVTRVLEDGPADRAGLREDDVITRINGQSLFDPLPGDAEDDFDLDESIQVQRLLAIARGLEPGEEVDVEYLREGEVRVTTVEAADLSRGAFSLVPPDFDGERLRDQIRLYTDGIREQARSFRREGPDAGARLWGGGGGGPFVFGFGGAFGHGLEMVEVTPGLGEYFGVSEGVLVTDIDDESTLGLEPGDVILAVGDREVTTPERVRRILQSYRDEEEITFRVQRDGRAIDVLGRLDG